MAHQINSVNIYYGNLNKLIMECVTPEMENWSSVVTHWFWERGCIGGKHLKVRWMQDNEHSNNVRNAILKTVAKFQAQYPSAETASEYKAVAAKRLIEAEKRAVSEEETAFKMDCAVSLPYERQPDADASEELFEVLHDFMDETREFCRRSVNSDKNHTLFALQLIAVFAITQYNSIEEGCITFRAHWDNYEQWFKPQVLPEKIKLHYQNNRLQINTIVKDVIDKHQSDKLPADEDFAFWIKTLNKYRLAIYQKLQAGVVFIPTPTNSEGVIETQDYLKKQDTNSRSGQFLNLLFSEPDYLGGLSQNYGLQVTKILVNLIYHVVSNLGLSSFQRMSCCYFIHRSVEDILNIDLINLLDEKMKTILNKNIEILN